MANIRLPDHSHCKFCGDPIPFGDEYCGDECRREDALRESQEKRKDYIFYGISIAVIAVLIALRYATLQM